MSVNSKFKTCHMSRRELTTLFFLRLPMVSQIEAYGCFLVFWTIALLQATRALNLFVCVC